MNNEIHLQNKAGVVLRLQDSEAVFFNGDNPHYVITTPDKIFALAKRQGYRLWVGYPTVEEQQS